MLPIPEEYILDFIRYMYYHLEKYIDELKSALDECSEEFNNYEEDSDLFKQAYAFGLTVYNTFNDNLRNPLLKPESLSDDDFFNFMVTITAFYFSGLKLRIVSKQCLTDIKATKVIEAVIFLCYKGSDFQGEFAEFFYEELNPSQE